MQKVRRMRSATILLIIGVVIGIVFSFVTCIAVERTAGVDFCGSCHTMRPFVTSYEMNVHGGNDHVGFRAQCTDCHLPHDNLPDYLVTKVKTGLNDIWVETFNNTSQIDWHGNLKYRSTYVYDSGCLKCHSNLEDESLSNPRAFLPHRSYFAKTISQTCVDCHKNAGHKNLIEFISK